MKRLAKELLQRIWSRTPTVYFLVSAALVILLVLGGAGTKKQNIALELPQVPLGDPSMGRSFDVALQYRGQRASSVITLDIPGTSKNLEETERYLDHMLDELPLIMSGESDDLDGVTNDLVLPTSFRQPGTSIQWIIDDETLIDETGAINWIRAESVSKSAITALVSLYGVNRRRTYDIQFAEPRPDELHRFLKMELEETIDEMKQKAKKGAIHTLPEVTNRGIKLEWSVAKKGTPVWYLILTFLLFLLVYRRRYDRTRKRLRMERAALVQDLPEFVDKLTLLLFAGSFAPMALKRMTMDYERVRDAQSIRPLYEALSIIQRKVDETNMSLSNELRQTARDSGVRQWMRIASILSENLDKGVSLAEKLEIEGSMLRKERQRSLETVGKMAETKLMFPMVLLLLAILIITTGPIFLVM